MKKIDWKKLTLAILICEGAGWLGAMATTPKIGGWYGALNKPFFSPPNWVFGPVWTGLYLLMAIGLYTVWQKKKKLDQPVFYWFWVQLLLNIIWSYVFFGGESPGMGLFVIGLLWVAIYRMKKDIPYQLPYLLWVSFAALLNAGIWWLN